MCYGALQGDMGKQTLALSIVLLPQHHMAPDVSRAQEWDVAAQT